MKASRQAQAPQESGSPVPRAPVPDGAAKLASALGASLGLKAEEVLLLRHYLQCLDRIERDMHALRHGPGPGAQRTHEGPAPWIEPHR